MALSMNGHQITICPTLEPPPGYAVERIIGPCWVITVRSRTDIAVWFGLATGVIYWLFRWARPIL